MNLEPAVLRAWARHEKPTLRISFVLVVQNRQIQRNRRHAVGYQRIGEKGREEVAELSWLRQSSTM